jgi:Fe-S-cluster containining protein
MVDADNPCAECGGRCCSFRSMQISFVGLEEGERYDSRMIEMGEALDQVLLEDGSLPDMEWYVLDAGDGARRIVFECGHLDDDGMCGVYDDRPPMCREFQCTALDPDNDASLEDMVEEYAPGDAWEDADLTGITERAEEIIEREAG